MIASTFSKRTGIRGNPDAETHLQKVSNFGHWKTKHSVIKHDSSVIIKEASVKERVLVMKHKTKQDSNKVSFRKAAEV